MITQKWHATTTTRHSYTRISSLRFSRHLTRPRVASRYSVWTSNYFTCRSRCGNPTFLGALHTPVAEHPLSKFLNLPLTLVCCLQACADCNKFCVFIIHSLSVHRCISREMNELLRLESVLLFQISQYEV